MSKAIKKLDQESYIREEKEIFNGSDPEILKYLQTLVCFVNYLGGVILTKKVTDKNHFKSFFDAAALEDKINSYIEPPIDGIISVSKFNKGQGVKIRVEKSNRSPHFYKADGFFTNSKGKKIFIFQRGTIGIRRSGKNDIFTSQDFESIFKGKFSEIFKGIQEVIVKQPIDALIENIDNLKSISTEAVYYKHDSNNPNATPVKYLLDTEPFDNINEELKASVKSWKTNGTLPSESLIAKAYLGAGKIKDYEIVKLLLFSSIEKSMPFCLWATKIKKSDLRIIIKDLVKKDTHPHSKEAIKLNILMPYNFSKEVFEIAKNTRYFNLKRLLTKIEKLDLKNKRLEMVKRILYPGDPGTTQDAEGLKTTVSDFINGDKKQKGVIKYRWRILDLLLYGEKLLK